MEIEQTLNEILVKLFRNINAIEEQAIRTEEYKNVTTNDMHVIEAIGIGSPKNMTAVAKELGVTTGTLTISVNSLSLSRKGIKAYEHHHRFHEEMIGAVVERLTDGEKAVLEKALKNLNRFFRDKAAE